MEWEGVWNDFHMTKDKDNFELQMSANKTADTLSVMNEVNKENDYQQFSNSVITMWSSVLKVVEVAMERRYLIDNGFSTR